MAAQVVDPGAVAVAGRQMHPVRRGADRFQVALAVGQCLPQVEVDAALAVGQFGQLLVDIAQVVAGKAGPLGRRFGPDRRDGLDIDDAVLPQRFPQGVQHGAVVGQKALLRAGGGQGVGAQQDIQLFGLGRRQHVEGHLVPAGHVGGGHPVDDSVGARPDIAADQRAAEVDVIVGEADRQAVAQKGRVGKIGQVHLTGGRLPDDAAVVGADGIGPRALTVGAEGQHLGRGAAPLPRLHGQRRQDALHRAGRQRFGQGGGGLLPGRLQNGGDGRRQQQDGRSRAQRLQLAVPAALPGPAAGVVIFMRNTHF